MSTKNPRADGLPQYTVTAVRLGSLRVPKAAMTYMSGFAEEVNLPVWAALIEGNGLRALVDTGIRDHGKWDRELNPCWREDDETIEAGLAELGWSVKDVDLVINSHLHYDHAENNVLLPHAQFFVSLAEWDYAREPIATQRWLYDYSWTSEALTYQNYTMVAQDHYDVRPGIRLLQTPGHSRGHQSVLVNTAQGVLCIAGDAACFMDNFSIPTPPGGLTSAEQALTSIERIRLHSDVVLMNHDPTLTKYQTGGFPQIAPATTE